MERVLFAVSTSLQSVLTYRETLTASSVWGRVEDLSWKKYLVSGDVQGHP